MRILKTQTVALLQAENSLLRQQGARCTGQTRKFDSMCLGSMSGQSIDAAEQKLRMQAAIGMAHAVFYESLASANSKNIDLVQSLPETSPGVLDTSVAQSRIEEALQKKRSLQSSMDSALEEIRAVNDWLWQTFVDATEDGGGGEWSPVDEGPVRAYYQGLIQSQDLVVRANKNLLTRASEYDRKSLEVYRGVDTSYLQKAMGSANSYLGTGNWADTSWVGVLRFTAMSRGAQSVALVNTPEADPLSAFLGGSLKEESSVAGGEVRGSTALYGMPVFGAVSGDALGLTLSLTPYSKGSGKDGGKEFSDGVGGKAEFGLYGAKSKVEGGVGLFSMSNEAEVLAGTVSGSIGGSLLHEDSWDPSFELGGMVEGSVLSSKTKAKLGIDDYDLHATAEGDAFTAKSEAKIHMGTQGVEARVGAEAYAVTGGLTYGATFLGVKVDYSVEGKVAGAGAKVGGKLDASSAEGEIGAGLGLGVGVKLKVDWSGLAKKLSSSGARLGEWWNSIWNK